MSNSFLPYSYTGLNKLLAFKEVIAQAETELNEKKVHPHADKSAKKIIDKFTSIFCEHELADTDYIAVQTEAVGYKSLADYISKNSLPLSFILKCLTYFIWTDRIIEGYFINRLKDRSMGVLLNQLHRELNNTYAIV